VFTLKVKDIIKNNKVTVSFEVFPPKEWDKVESTKAVINELAKLSPSFMSVTYGAAGTTSGFTTEIANSVKENGITPLAHLTCLTSTRDKIHTVVNELKENGIENILALRGDIPKDFVFPDKQYYTYASQLIEEIHTLGDFCVGGACYPEIHPESENRVTDIAHLKEKVDCGLDFLTTQMFFDNEVFYNFREMCAIKGIDVPLVAGIMPITNVNLIERTVKLAGCSLPKKFTKLVDRFGTNNAAMKQAGIVYAMEQIVDLLANGVNNIHIYTMNKPDIAEKITQGIGDIINE
jgi:methylenetetrahydrofolate reductase (NADPH)